ncbi:MAG: hypothetical protein ACLRPT_11780 [Akkermansia muciniphila]
MLKSSLSSLVEKTGTNRAGELGLMADFLAGNKTGLKNKLMGMMANAPNGLENTVILEERNAKCMEVFDRWSGKGVRRIGVFYGAAHLPGLHGALWNAATASGRCAGFRRGAPGSRVRTGSAREG